MASRSGLKLSHILVLVLVGVLVILAGLFRAERPRPAEESVRINCRHNLNEIAKGMATYLDEFGDGCWYPWPAGRPGCGTVAEPNFGGAEWLATLYWTRIVPDVRYFVCPASGDSNKAGKLLGADGCPGGERLAPRAVSYAGFGHTSVAVYQREKLNRKPTSLLAITKDFPPDEPMACDDTQAPINHGERDNGGMAILFFDTHVEYWTHTKICPEHGVGQGELVHLRN